MTNLSSFLAAVMAIFMAMTAVTAYTLSGWKWKAKPWIPFVMGLGLLVGFVLLNWQLDNANSRLARNAIEPAASQSAALFSAIVQGNLWEMKLIELIGIPLAVSLVTTALTIKVDRELIEEQRKFERRSEEISRIEHEIQNLEIEIEDALKSGLRGAELTKRWKDLRALKDQRLREKWDIQDDFETLIDSNLVKELKARPQ